jgi:tRNA (mo5U34)-methyltransferase
MNIQWYEPLFRSLVTMIENDNLLTFRNKLEETLKNPSHGHFPGWNEAYLNMPTSMTSHIKCDQAVIEIGEAHELDAIQHTELIQHLKALMPWRKGPFKFFGTLIDAEWQSNLKWQRIAKHIHPEHKKILDVGCGNGYYMLRMHGAGAHQVVGIDPNLLYLAQFYALQKCLHKPLQAHLIPMPFEELPTELNYFDYVFSMGVLYHRRDPIQHLQKLYQHTSTTGILCLETLVLDQAISTELIPVDRYAGMRNVWSIPSPTKVLEWLDLAGFKDGKLIDIQQTTIEEQRSTAWMKNYSLVNFLDAKDPTKTIEQYPAPTRAVFLASK